MEDGISGGLQHCHEMCCEKGGCCGRRACMVQRWFHRGDVVSRQVDLYMTVGKIIGKLAISEMVLFDEPSNKWRATEGVVDIFK